MPGARRVPDFANVKVATVAPGLRAGLL